MKEKGWREITWGGLVLEPGSAIEYETGTWRAFRPIIELEKCTHCMFCWIYCPDGAILVEDSKVKGIDLKHCKGCGICAQECPRKVITMMEEAKAKEAIK
jgi:2-oxoacid:acceptor oxidoreductase delta subunit (pyruvate/2-ketoisovalerate family)